jgi:hypothetical protein
MFNPLLGMICPLLNALHAAHVVSGLQVYQLLHFDLCEVGQVREGCRLQQQLHKDHLVKDKSAQLHEWTSTATTMLKSIQPEQTACALLAQRLCAAASIPFL